MIDAPATIEPWLDWMRAGDRAPGTLRTRRYHLARFIAETQDPLAVDAIAEHLANSRWAPATRRSVRTSLSLWTGWLHRTGRIDSDPMLQLPKSVIPKHLPRPCPEAIMEAALQTSTTRVIAMIELAGNAGLRRSEIATVGRGDLIPDLLGHSLLVHGKGGRERVVPLSPRVYSSIQRQLHEVPDWSPWLFPARDPAFHLMPIRIGELLSEALPGQWSGHSLRHRFGTRAYNSSHNLLLVQTLMGHSKPETTAGYIGLDVSGARDLVNTVAA